MKLCSGETQQLVKLITKSKMVSLEHHHALLETHTHKGNFKPLSLNPAVSDNCFKSQALVMRETRKGALVSHGPCLSSLYEVYTRS